MGEPIKLYDKYGVETVTYSPSWANAQVVAGLLFEQPPVSQVPSGDARQRAIEEAARLSGVEPYPHTLDQPVTPNDTQEVPVVRKPRKREQGTGVL